MLQGCCNQQAKFTPGAVTVAVCQSMAAIMVGNIALTMFYVITKLPTSSSPAKSPTNPTATTYLLLLNLIYNIKIIISIQQKARYTVLFF